MGKRKYVSYEVETKKYIHCFDYYDEALAFYSKTKEEVVLRGIDSNCLGTIILAKNNNQ